MKTFLRILFGALFVFTVWFGLTGLILGLTSDSPRPLPGSPTVIMEVQDPSLAPYAAAWQREIGRRFPNAVGVLCHGGMFIDGQWITSARNMQRLTLATRVAEYEKERYPGRTIVMLCCNPGHLDLGVSGVYFARDNVWCVPDKDYNPADADGFATLCQAQHPPFSQPVRPLIPTTRPVVKIPLIPIAPFREDSFTVLRSDLYPGGVGNIFEFVKD